MLYYRIRGFEYFLLLLLIWGMLILPTSYMIFKLITILILVFSNICYGRYKKPYASVVVLILTIIYIRGIWSISNGLLQNSLKGQELLNQLPFIFLYPALLYLLFPYLRGKKSKDYCTNAVILAHILIIGINIYNLLVMMLGFPVLNLSEDMENLMYDETTMGFSTNNLHQLIFTTPFVVTMGFCGKIKPKFFIPLLIITFGFIVLTSRAVLIVVAAISMTIPYLLKWKFHMLSSKNLGKVTFVVSILLVLLAIRFSQNVYVNSSFDDFMAHFDRSSDSRFNQREVLTREWLESPLIGKGQGKEFHTFNGTTSHFESTYHSDLAHNGIIGFGLFTLYMSIILYNIYKKSKQERDVFYFACFMGLFCCVVGASTNPVLGTFDRLFSIYICIACLNLPKVKYAELSNEIKDDKKGRISIVNNILSANF